MGSCWSRLYCYAYYRIVSLVCVRIELLLYEDEIPHRIPYERVPLNMMEDVYKHAMKPHLYRPNTSINHLMTFMRYYEGKCTYNVWNRLYEQYFRENYWIAYYSVTHWLNFLWLRRSFKIEETEKKILDYNKPSVVGSLDSVSQYAKAKGISRPKAKKELEKNLAYTLHKPRRRRGLFQPVVVFDIEEQWVADLEEVQTIAKQNKGLRYILVVIDAFSKYARAQPIKKKTGKDASEAFAKIHKQADGCKPQTLQTDEGKEFYNQVFQNLLKQHDIHHFSTHGDAKASIVERFNRTIKSKLYKYFTAANTLNYVDVLPKLVYQYNHSYHRSIRTTPAKVTFYNAKEVWDSM